MLNDFLKDLDASGYSQQFTQVEFVADTGTHYRCNRFPSNRHLTKKADAVEAAKIRKAALEAQRRIQARAKRIHDTPSTSSV